MHRALATPTARPGFGAEPMTAADMAALATDARALAADAFQRLAGVERDEAIGALFARRDAAFALIDRLALAPASGQKTRIHGDYHLGQVLIAEGDFHIIDFEGEPRRSLSERIARASPLRDVAGMLRSFDYAAFAAIDRVRATGADATAVEPLAWTWRDRAAARFLDGWRQGCGDGPVLPEDFAALDLFLMQKVFYEIGYEAAHRPRWLSIPVRGALKLIDAAG